VYSSLLVRRNGETSYGVRVRAAPTSVVIQLIRTVNGALTALATQTVPGYVFASGDVMHLRVQAVGTGSTALRASFWVNAQPVPTSWPLQATDTTAALQAPGGVGVHGYLSSTSTGPFVMTVDNITATPAP
jgi:hypothetical protein